MKNFLSVIIIAAVIFCFATCKDSISSPLEYGNVRITFVNDAGRTIYPQKIFDHYVYTFTKQAGSPQAINPSNDMFTLETGNWNVRVDAYIGAIIPQNRAATGTADFTLDADEGIVVSIFLQAEETTGYGTFKYRIQYPAGTTAEIFTLTKLPEMSTIDLIPLTEGITISGTKENVPSGIYQLNVRFTNSGLYAGTNEIVHIYALLTTEYGTTQSPVIFKEEDFSSLIPITSAEIIVIAPVKNAVPGITASGTGYFSIGVVSWEPEDNPFLGNTVYTAAVTLTANNGYTFSTLNPATINGQNAVVSNNTGAAVTLSHTFPATNIKTTTEIVIKNQPTKLIYTHGEPLDLTGLVAMLTYDDTTKEDVAAADFTDKNITANPADGNHLIHLTHNGQPVMITYGELTPLATNVLTVNKAPGNFGTPESVNTTYTPELTLDDLTLPFGYAWDVPSTTLNAGNNQSFAATYTDPSGNCEAANGTITVNVAKTTGIFGIHSVIYTTYTPTLTLASLNSQLTNGYVWDAPSTTLNAGNNQSFAATYTDPSGNYETANGTITVNVAKATGEKVDAPTLNTKTHNSITINAVNTPDTEQIVEYASNTSNFAPVSGWQTDTSFSDLEAGTIYYIFARSKEEDNYNKGEESASLTVTTLQTVSPDRFEYYWVDQHGKLATTSDGATSIAPGETLIITAQSTGYIVHQWHLDGVSIDQSGNTYTFSSMAAGKHIVGLFVEKDDKLYNTNITITVR